MAKKSRKPKRTLGRRKKTKQVSDPQRAFFQQSVFQQALTHHQAGHLPEAEVLYRQILSAEPNHPDALNFLGLLAHQVGKSEIAVELISKAINCRPEYVDAHSNLGVIFNDLGKLDKAVASFRQALILKPDYAEIHSNLGNALRDQGKLDEAIAVFRQALILKPNYAETHFNLGNALKDQGKLDEAIAGFRQALILKPDYAEAHNNLGNALHDQGNPDEAIASFRQAFTVRPDFAGAHFNLGNALIDQGKLDEALTSFRQALALKPDYAEAHNSLGFIFKELGRMDDAIANFRKALSQKQDYVGAFKNLSLIIKFTEVDDVIHAMEDLYNKKGDMSDADHIHLGFSLGKVFEDLKNYRKSFNFFLGANLLKRESYEYSMQNDRDLFERIKKTFSSEFFAAHHGSGNQDGTPVFILGMPRSGTTLVEQILASHPLVFGAGELMVLTDLVNDICTGEETAQFPECMLDLGVDEFERMGSDYIEKIREYSNDVKYLTDKMPNNFFRVGLIRTILPDAKVIHCIRDPMDTCFSIFKHEFTGTHMYAYDMTELGRYYNLYRDLMAHWEKVLPGFMYTLRYEDMVEDQQDQTRSLLDFCGLPWDEACLNFHKTERRVSTASLAQVRQPIYRDSIKLWQRHEKQLEPLRKAIYG